MSSDSYPFLIFDADPMVYRCAFSAQSTVYDYTYETKDGKLRNRVWSDGRKAQKFFRRYPGLTVLDCSPIVTAAPPSFARQAAKVAVTNTIQAVCRHYECRYDQLNLEFYLSGPGNFREQLAKRIGYKSGRKQEPPIHYQVVRDFFTDKYGARIVEGWEADDQCAIRAGQLRDEGIRYVIATIDKDLDQIPGLHYDFMKKIIYDVSEWEADLFFWAQCLSGDHTDTIPGLHRVGPDKARSMVLDWQEEWAQYQAEEDLALLEEAYAEYMWDRVCEEYRKNAERYPEKYETVDPEAAALETARLVKMMDYENQLWTPPGEDDELLPY